ncbi:TnsA endonuclease N-terminal domain-containing protein [Lutispora sp.]|uniref:TnsA endonuclease N-terminal domain-containing protein n=1 Tax=Lutispora sp. TaxID=2828727 RepID=UPI0035637B47
MYTPINTKRNTHYGSNYWEAYSPKLKRSVHMYSDLEYDDWVLIETDPNVSDFCEQPVKIKRFYDGRYAESIIDMWVKYRDNTEQFLEIKYSNELDVNNPKSLRTLKQIRIQQDWCSENGYKHIVRTEKEIRSNPVYLENMKQLLPYLREDGSTNELDKKRVLNFISNERYSISNIAEYLESISKQRILAVILNLIYRGEIHSNVANVPISDKLEVWV